MTSSLLNRSTKSVRAKRDSGGFAGCDSMKCHRLTAIGEERKGFRFVLFLSCGTALKEAHIHRELIAGGMDQGFVAEVASVARWAAYAAITCDLCLTFRTWHFKRRIARPLLAACGAGDGHNRLICLSAVQATGFSHWSAIALAMPGKNLDRSRHLSGDGGIR